MQLKSKLEEDKTQRQKADN